MLLEQWSSTLVLDLHNPACSFSRYLQFGSKMCAWTTCSFLEGTQSDQFPSSLVYDHGAQMSFAPRGWRKPVRTSLLEKSLNAPQRRRILQVKYVQKWLHSYLQTLSTCNSSVHWYKRTPVHKQNHRFQTSDWHQPTHLLCLVLLEGIL